MLVRCLFILSLLFSVKAIFAEPTGSLLPSWYKQQNIKTEHHYTYIGYGSGKNILTAKKQAREDIATQLFVIVESVTESDSKLENDNFSSSSRHRSKQQTRATLSNLKVLTLESVDNYYYVALAYQHLSYAQKFINKLNVTSCKDEIQHPYLRNTPLFKELNDKLPCLINIELVRRNHTWMLGYKDILIQLDAQKFSDIYTTMQTKSLQINPSATRLKEGDKFSVSINAIDTGYVTLFNVYADGIVSLLQENIPIESNKERIFPLESDEVVFEAGLLEKGKETLDLYIGLYSKTPLVLSKFREASTTVQNDQRQYQFDYLLQLMKKQSFSVVLLRIFPT